MLEIIFCVFIRREGVLKRVAENNFVDALIPPRRELEEFNEKVFVSSMR